MKDEVENLELLRQKLGLNKINLFGESWGSMLALLYATTYPDHVHKIVLTAAIGVTAEGMERFRKELENRLTDEDKDRLSLIKEGLEKGESTIDDLLKVLDPYYVYAKGTLQRKEKTSIQHQVNQAIGTDIANNYDLREELLKLSNIPIVVIQGSHDILTPSIIQELLIDHIPHSELVTIDQCGHWTVVEKPTEVNNITKEFLRGT